jgi:alkylhydroperoxidase family enzyme
MASLIAFGCFYNRVTALLACPPEVGFERFSESILGRLMALAGPWLLRPRANRKRMASGDRASNQRLPEDAAFRSLAEALEGLPAAVLLCETLESALASPVLPRRTKLLMFAVVARALECSHCQAESRALLADEGLGPEEVDRCVAALGSQSLEPHESSILRWVRGTVHYEPWAIQQRTHELKEEVGEATLLEAVGVAALANGTVRLAMLLE